MKVFISWSGELSKQVAELLAEWIPSVIQSAHPWVSTGGIEKGEVWFNAIAEQLADGAIGIICLTQEHMDARWILFEAGALSKGLTTNRVCTFLINLDPSQLVPPLSQFNATKPVKEDVLQLIQTINKQEKQPLPEVRLKAAFEQWWGVFEDRFKKILSKKPSKIPAKRPVEDMVTEILELSRAIQRNLQEHMPSTPSRLNQLLSQLAERQTLKGLWVSDGAVVTPKGTIMDLGTDIPAHAGSSTIAFEVKAAPHRAAFNKTTSGQRIGAGPQEQILYLRQP
jgi:hypothetical protein